jgi:hypothetical protein
VTQPNCAGSMVVVAGGAIVGAVTITADASHPPSAPLGALGSHCARLLMKIDCIEGADESVALKGHAMHSLPTGQWCWELAATALLLAIRGGGVGCPVCKLTDVSVHESA